MNIPMESKYKYLVTAGCSLTFGQGCEYEKTYPSLLANKLGLKLINLAVCGTGWYSLQTSITSFINNNKDILHECFFILQSSTLERRVNYNEIPIVRSDVWEDYNIQFVSKIHTCALGWKDWEKYYDINKKPEGFTYNNRSGNHIFTPHEIDCNVSFFPEHKLYPNSRNRWKYPTEHGDITPPYIHQQFEGLIEHWAQQISSFHLFLKTNNINHIIIDGYVPFVSYKLNFRNYFKSEIEYDMTKKFWSIDSNDLNEKIESNDEYMIYDFKNIKSGWMFDLIDSKYKIDDVVIFNLFFWNLHGTEWNLDGGHAGPKGMELISEVIHTNLIEKKWF